jgi:protein-S-isoprenylcysteine O-methyltransferase Ste14
MIRKALVLVYGATAYLAFLAALLYTIGFLANVAVPTGIDDGVAGPAWRALVVDAALLTLFAAQHSVMARPWFKRWWTRFVPTAVERSTYVLASTAVLVLLLWQWQPLPATVWSVGPDWARAVLWTLYGLGWVVLVYSTFAVGHFDLFGLRQILDRARVLFALAGTGYIMVGVRLEEHDLRAQLGEPYEDYLRRTPRFVPRPVR